MLNLEDIDIFAMADEGFSFNVLGKDNNPTDAVIELSAIFGKKGKDARVKYEAKERELLVKHNLTGKIIADVKKKVEDKEPVDEALVKTVREYEEATEDAYIKYVLVPLTKNVTGLAKDGEPYTINDKTLFELYKKYPTIQAQAITEIYNVEKLAKN